jgi:phage gp36-like protein
MPYSTDADLTNDVITPAELVQLTDDEGLGSVNAARTTAARAKIDELIDGHLRGGGYTLPLTSTPPMLKTISIDGTVCYLYERRFKAQMPESIQKKLDAILRLLAKIQKREILIGADAAVEAAGGNYQTNKTADDRKFTKDVLDTY